MTYFNQDDRQGGRKSFGGGKRSFGDRRGEDRKMYPATCHECGRDCQVPFFPDGSKPVYCSSCFQKNQGDFSQKRPEFGGKRDFVEQKVSQNQSHDVLVSINSKLERMLTLMATANKSTPTSKEIVVEPVKKTKKVVKKTEKA
ncbi:MAG: CxxC-x17-CxxC domain-containing protein [Candidatus Shapirobacteria bacterium]